MQLQHSNSRFCALHPTEPLTHFCESVRDVACETCLRLGPYADMRHQAVPIQDAAELRTRFYLAFVEQQVTPLRERVYLKLQGIAERQQRVREERKVVQKDVSLQFEGIERRINLAGSQQMIERQTEIKHYQQVINRIDDLAYSFEGVNNFPQRFLMGYKQFHQQLKSLENMEWKEVSQPGEGKNLTRLVFPREWALKIAEAGQLGMYATKNAVMNQLIGKGIDHFKNEMTNATKGIAVNLKRVLTLYNAINLELAETDKCYICAYCLTPLSVEEANQPCTHNKNYKTKPTYEVDIPDEVKGNKMHFWVEARKEERPKPDAQAHVLVRNAQKKQFRSSLKDIRQVRYKLKAFDIEMGQPGAHLAEFKATDPGATGKVSELTFMYLMTNKFEVTEVQAQVLQELCKEEEGDGIDYMKVEAILEDPLQPLKKFEADEDQADKSKPIAPVTGRYRY